MAKNKGKKFNEEGKNIAKPNIKMKQMKRKGNQKRALNPGPALTGPSGATTPDPDLSNDGGSSRNVEKAMGIKKRLSGFIFMCNASTKLECFRYRVFGLPVGKRSAVEEIKPGTKLFLFDFEKKLLYGIYEATSAGQVNLEPAAFGGKYPVQVKFKIFKECLPLHESSLKHTIKENYNGSKFKQELGGHQVKKLLSSFQPLAPLLSPLISQAPQNVPLSWAKPAPARENQFNDTVRHPPMKVPYVTDTRYVHPAPVGPAHVQSAHEAQYFHAAPMGPALVQSTRVLQQGYHRPASDVEHVHKTLAHQSLSATGRYSIMPNSQRPYFAGGIANEVQGLYPSYRTIEERAPHEQVTNLGRQYHHLPLQRESLYKDNAAGYNSFRHALATKYTSNMQVAPAPYTLPVEQVQLPAPRRPQGSSTYYSYAGAN